MDDMAPPATEQVGEATGVAKTEVRPSADGTVTFEGDRPAAEALIADPELQVPDPRAALRTRLENARAEIASCAREGDLSLLAQKVAAAFDVLIETI